MRLARRKSFDRRRHLFLVHLPVRIRHLDAVHERRQPPRILGDTGRAAPDNVIVHDERLPAARYLARYRVDCERVAVLGNVYLRGQSAGRRSLEHTHVAHARKRHMQRARNGRSRQRKNVDFGAKIFDLFFIGHAEFLFLVEYEQFQVFELDLAAQQLMRAANDVHRSVRKPVESFRLVAFHARERRDVYAELFHALFCGVVVLMTQYCRRRKKSHLPAFADHLERYAQRDLGLAETDVAANEPIHDLARYEIVHARVHCR